MNRVLNSGHPSKYWPCRMTAYYYSVGLIGNWVLLCLHKGFGKSTIYKELKTKNHDPCGRFLGCTVYMFINITRKPCVHSSNLTIYSVFFYLNTHRVLKRCRQNNPAHSCWILVTYPGFFSKNTFSIPQIIVIPLKLASDVFCLIKLWELKCAIELQYIHFSRIEQTICKLKCVVGVGYPDSKAHRNTMGPIWGRQVPGGPHVGPMKFIIWVPTVQSFPST